VLTGTLAGDTITDRTLTGNTLTFIAIAIDAVPAHETFLDLAGQLVDYIHAAQPIAPGHPVMVPGEKEQRVRGVRAQAGIPVDDFIWQRIVECAEQVNYHLPETRGSL
jgi:LDH2 family malate/lactate/ureidoglycolate dehydrogenase